MIQNVSNSFSIGLTHDALNHLWQSTVFAAAMILLVFACRNNSARIRFWLWTTASLKFLVPFAALEWIGAHVGWSVATPATLRWSYAIEEVSRPFDQPRVIMAVADPARTPIGAGAVALWIWAAGVAVTLAVWAFRWMRLRRTVRAMSPLTEGRAFELVRALRQAPVRLMSSASMLEPGVFGVFRPVLVLPAGIVDRLGEAQLEAVIRHELAHIERKDNLIAALHMFVEALFWFHPVVWWLGSRQLDERERACDEAVLGQFNQPKAYAQGILEVCQHYLESSVPCVAGVTGADLKKRIQHIMTQQRVTQLTAGRRWLLAAAATAAVLGPIGIGLVNAPLGRAQSSGNAPKEFEVASVKQMEPAMGGMMRVEIQLPPGRFIAKGLTLRLLMQQAYGVRDFQIQGAPGWATTDRYEINAKTGEGPISRDDLKPMLQALLADRFKLALRRETKESSVYELVVAKNGPKLTESEGGRGDQVRMGRGFVEAHGAAPPTIANFLANVLGRAVIDKTGLTKRYDFKLEWTPDDSQNAMVRQAHPDAPPAPPADNSGPSIFTALQEQLGLKLENAKGPVDLLIVEKVEKPTDN
ncbi:MAG: TIGR03435 family protein [Acidobacteria bacterium]|nr:TIGR03435 family protein [Acidobacteriota bacterium]